ncbi:MAG TPA: DNA ligase [Yinghuangia sp.]|nr:DNA ligase [Yinghuangia sp.]
MRPKPVRDVPAEDALPGGTQYSIKLDGWRALAFARGDEPAVLQARSGRDLAPGFPELDDALRSLPDGAVLDGELCAWHEGRFAFGQLIRPPKARARDGAQIAYVAFDLLALPGHDIRDRPLRERWDLLTTLLSGVEPPLQLVMATNDRAEAMSWREALAPTGVEGLVAKGLGTPYRPTRHGGWLKVRDRETIDVQITAFSGTPRRPRTLVTELPDGTEALTSPQLDSRQAREVAAALTDRIHPPVDHADLGSVHPITPLTAETQRDPGRSPYLRFIRLRGD